MRSWIPPPFPKWKFRDTHRYLGETQSPKCKNNGASCFLLPAAMHCAAALRTETEVLKGDKNKKQIEASGRAASRLRVGCCWGDISDSMIPCQICCCLNKVLPAAMLPGQRRLRVLRPCYRRSRVLRPCYRRSRVLRPCYRRSRVLRPCYRRSMLSQITRRSAVVDHRQYSALQLWPTQRQRPPS
jgi:hypothetical protein